ncbi:DNA repair protein complementing XP-A cells homolog [Haliotis cracherodii]|uniref:DNA repair protein complementing XP-A cells homolog n=1 Tax=Haliotis cracherodii TaxID=6455 RepID=UPI0039E80A29
MSEDAVDDSPHSPDTQESETKLTKAQLARIERNRQKALLLKQARLQSRPYPEGKPDKHKVKAPPREIDSGGGFYIEEDDEALQNVHKKIIHPEGAVLAVDNLVCDGCGKEFMESFLLNHFELAVCDICRQNEEKYGLITKSDAKKRFLLKDCDFDQREPALKFIIRKNPHNPRWGDMKLYLETQVTDRAMEVWGDEEKLEEQHEKRDQNREKSKQKKFDKRVKELRMAVRSSLWRKDSGSHEHDFGEETYDEDEDMYSKTCKSCGHVMTYEKM